MDEGDGLLNECIKRLPQEKEKPRLCWSVLRILSVSLCVITTHRFDHPLGARRSQASKLYAPPPAATIKGECAARASHLGLQGFMPSRGAGHSSQIYPLWIGTSYRNRRLRRVEATHLSPELPGNGGAAPGVPTQRHFDPHTRVESTGEKNPSKNYYLKTVG